MGNDYIVSYGGSFDRHSSAFGFLSGDEGNDKIQGSAKSEWFGGGLGKDTIIGFGGEDTSIYFSATESKNSILKMDVITDFKKEDDALFFNFDANPLTAENENFKFIGNANVFKGIGQIRFDHDSYGYLG